MFCSLFCQNREMFCNKFSLSWEHNKLCAQPMTLIIN